MSKFCFFSPLEQFEILPLQPLHFFFFDISITNQTISLFLIIFFVFTYFFSSLKQSDFSLYIIPHRWQILVECFYCLILNMVQENIGGKKVRNFFL